MKAITILQPWASLIACGAKRFETRSWATKYRGPIAIHAGKNWPAIVTDKTQRLPEMIHLALCWRGGFAWLADLPMGSVIAIAELVECWAIDGCGHDLMWKPGVNDEESKFYYTYPANIRFGKQKAEDFNRIRYPETVFGNYPDYGFLQKPFYAWQLENIRPIDPVPAKGRQRLWEWEGV